MTSYKPIPGAHVLVGIDISKHRHEVLIAVPGKHRRRRQQRFVRTFLTRFALGRTVLPDHTAGPALRHAKRLHRMIDAGAATRRA
jgi:hypothetical protein